MQTFVKVFYFLFFIGISYESFHVLPSIRLCNLDTFPYPVTVTCTLSPPLSEQYNTFRKVIVFVFFIATSYSISVLNFLSERNTSSFLPILKHTLNPHLNLGINIEQVGGHTLCYALTRCSFQSCG